MRVSECMTKNPVCCSATTTIQQVARMMKQYDCGCIPVCEDGGRPVGVLTDRDICCELVAEGRDPVRVTAFDMMHAPVQIIKADCSIEECCQLMERQQIRRVIVTDERGRCCGIISQGDIALHAPREETGEVVEAISRHGFQSARAF